MAKHKKNPQESLANKLGIWRELSETFNEEFGFDDIAEAADQKVIQILNIVAKASMACVDDEMFDRVFGDIASMAIEISKDKEEADEQRRLFNLAKSDPELADSSCWNYGSGYHEQSNGCAVGYAVAAYIDENVYSDGMEPTRHSWRCQSVFGVLEALFKEHGPEVIARCKEIVERHLDAQTVTSKNRRRSRESVHRELRTNT